MELDGETFKPKLIKNLFEKYRNLKILNLYGPTEATMFTTYSIINKYNIDNNYSTIGKPIYGSRALVVNSFDEILPTETKGELVLYEDKNSINNLALGYLNLEEITNSKFKIIKNIVDNDFIRIYKTGDIVKINKDFQLEYIGRTDDMVKINNGYLVSINEVEKKISDIISSKYDFCIVDVNFNTSKALVLFICTKEEVDLLSLKNYINSKLSFYMRIKEVIKIEGFPCNNSGKTDKNRLKEIANLNIINNKKVLPRNKEEKRIYEIIKKQCNNENFSINDDFIDDLGIDSLNMTVIYSLLNNTQISMQDLYTYTTVEKLASFLTDNNKMNIKNEIRDIKIRNDSKKFNLDNILLTGVTGFLGIHILYELLNNEKTKRVYCIVRNKGNLSGKERLYKKINFYFKLNKNQKELLDKKIEILDGDIVNENLGLDAKEYNYLQSKVNTVINCAANVRHYGKYEMFYKDNITSVLNILKFCQNNISLAHISTLSIAGFKDEKTIDKIFDEDTININQSFNNNPYLITKLIAEKCILNENLNSKIFRLGNIMPRSYDGKFQENYSNNAFLNAIRLILKINAIPKTYLDFKLELSPVDECASSIIKILLLNDDGKIYHIVNNNEISIRDIIKVLKDDINIVNKNDFIQLLKNYDEIGSEYIKEYILKNNLNDFSVQKTINILNDNNFKWSKISNRYLKYLIEIINNNRW